LIVPYIVWSIVASLLVSVVAFVAGHGFRLHNSFSLLWFFPALLFSIVVCVSCGKIAGGHPSIYVFAFFLSLALPDAFGLNYDKFMLPYFVAGLLLWRYLARITLAACSVASIFGAIAYYILLRHWNADYYIYTTGMSLSFANLTHKLFIIAYRFLAGFAGIIWVVAAVHLLQRRANVLPLIHLGRYTMGIYVLSMLANPFLYRIGVPHSNPLVYDWVFAPMTACALCVITVLITKLIERNRSVSSVLLGTLNASFHSAGGSRTQRQEAQA
jgi:hypothetical protein